MEYETVLNIVTSNGEYTIPFLNIEKLDNFTIGFSNQEEMINCLNRLLDLSIGNKDIINIYISGSRYIDNESRSLANIKYSGDDWEIQSLKDALVIYFSQNVNRINECDIKYVKTRGMMDFRDGNPINDRDIRFAVDAFLKDSYKKQRDMYFMIRGKVFVKVNRISEKINDKKNVEFSKIESYNDDFVQHLIELASRGDEYLEKAMEELSKVDLEDISLSLSENERGIFDGLDSSYNNNFDEEAYVLVECTGMTLAQLKAIQRGDESLTSFDSRHRK